MNKSNMYFDRFF